VNYSDDYLREVLPSMDPPLNEVPRPVLSEFESLFDDQLYRGEMGEYRARSVKWTYAVFEQLRLGNYEIDSFRRPPFFGSILDLGIGLFGQMSFGLFDPEFEQRGYGLIVATRLPSDYPGPETEFGSVVFRRLDKRFPIILRRMETELHALDGPWNGTSAAWARDSGYPPSWGFLTSGHVVSGIGVGGNVPLASGGMGKLNTTLHPPIDAAFVVAAPPSRAEQKRFSALSMIAFPAAGLPVDVIAKSGPAARHVVGVTNSMGVLNTSYFGIQVFLDQPCQPGDSGSLIKTSSGDAVALYSGAMRGATHNGLTNQTLGLGQHFEQALLRLNVSAFG
jgi:hypothetical protein